MADRSYDLIPVMAPYVDVHMLINLLDHLRENNLYDEKVITKEKIKAGNVIITTTTSAITSTITITTATIIIITIITITTTITNIYNYYNSIKDKFDRILRGFIQYVP